ncbi:ADP-ribosylglycohydrolase family protein [Paraferrimonas haliotis]|uniref:ADP-ribosylglycohydrolase n=1 Tax=Paraferrimonas haliotis TaxID=2013866 RepID=A0AA37TSY7_9GAMM|nr:ADP-ribosylglycohydrolase family protein [Paraferrimonas haliotis]GLS84945.1 putative ADP-ribosylglycohydrolase [Paraferrimonas haliotis]
MDLPTNLRFQACLLGGAIGDAFGAAVEFMSRDQILAQYGQDGVTDFIKAYGKIGAITDDTQMTLFTAEGLLRAWVRGKNKGITTEVGCVGHAYLRWLYTQGYQSPYRDDYYTPNGVLWNTSELHSQRAPGNTCLQALQDMKTYETFAVNNSKGCGGVMRVAPVGLYSHVLKRRPEKCFELASDVAHLTHGHPTGYLASGAFAVIIQALLENQSLEQACQLALFLLAGYPEHQETTAAINLALTLSKTNIPPHQAIITLGEGWIAEEALAIGIYCALVADNFKDLMSISVSHSGDSDSTGSIAGNLWGAQYGLVDCPSEWLEQLELKSLIETIATDLAEFSEWNIGMYSKDQELDERIWETYPGH